MNGDWPNLFLQPTRIELPWSVFDIADYWHKVYALYVETVVKYVTPSHEMADVLHDETSFYLGQWLAIAQNTSLPEFEDPRLQHHRFHEVATTAIQAA